MARNIDEYTSNNVNVESLHNSEIKIEYVDPVYLLHDVKDFDLIKNRHRIIAEPVGTRPNGSGDSANCGPPYLLLPEQAMLLKEYVRLRQKVPICSWNTELKPGNSHSESSSWNSSEKVLELATRIAKGRKAKAVKRTVKQNSSASERRVRHSDLENIEVTAEEVQGIINEMASAESLNIERAQLMHISQYDSADKAYEEVTFDAMSNYSGLRMKYAVFRDLWRRGFYMTDGLRFGCDYLLYEGKPGEKHARYLVKCASTMSAIYPLELAALSRVASQVKKDILLAIVAPDSFIPYYIVMSWWRS